MADIWSSAGGNITPQGNQWLYRHRGEVRGPVPLQTVVDKLLSGELDLKIQVAREGGEFHPISEVKAFAPHLEQVSASLKQNAGRRTMLVVLLFLVIAGVVGVVAMKQIKEEADVVRKTNEAKLAGEQKQKAAEKAAFLKSSDDLGLVALIQLGDIAEMKVGNSKPKSTSKRKVNKGKKRGKKRAVQAFEDSDQLVMSCQRGQQEIFSVLGQNLRKINVCVQNEKQNDNNSLPNTLKLYFVVKPEGATAEFEIQDRFYRAGPMRNCMLKVFRSMKFNSVGGSNCPVTIPIKIGG